MSIPERMHSSVYERIVGGRSDPGAAEDVPLVDLKMLAKPFGVLDEIPIGA
jgi:hypothetical protein